MALDSRWISALEQKPWIPMLTSRISFAYHSGPGRCGGLAQLVRAPALQAGGRGFESHTPHHLGIGT